MQNHKKYISAMNVLRCSKIPNLFLHTETKFKTNHFTHLSMGLEAVTVTRQSFSPGQISKLCRVLGRQLCFIRYTVGYKATTSDPRVRRMSNPFTSRMPQILWSVFSEQSCKTVSPSLLPADKFCRQLSCRQLTTRSRISLKDQRHKE